MGRKRRRKHKQPPTRQAGTKGSPPAAALGHAIRSRRKALGLTQAALARFAGCGLAFLYELETGKPSVRMDKLLPVLEVLGLTLRLEPGRTPLTIETAGAERS
jgi:y4mF family transcriptional regulator